jgi:hypothetical protein
MTYKQITIDIEHHMFILFPCVYRIRIGGCFYIGRTYHLHKRMRSHQAGINRLIPKYSRIVNFGGHHGEMENFRMYGRFVRILFDNPSIYVLHAELLEYDRTVLGVCAKEHALLRHYHGHKDCINKSYRPPIFEETFKPEIMKHVV